MMKERLPKEKEGDGIAFAHMHMFVFWRLIKAAQHKVPGSLSR